LKRKHTREFKLECCRQVATGHKRPAQIYLEHNLAESVQRISRPKNVTASTSCSGSVFGSVRTGPRRSLAYSQSSWKKPRMMCRTAKFPHLAYKGYVRLREPEGTRNDVR